MTDCENVIRGQVRGLGDWVLVPRVPTDAMLRAAQGAWLNDPLRRTTTMWSAMLYAAPQQPAAPSEDVNVAGMPEFDGLLDHIYEYGTASEGVIEKANAFARAVIARYAPQQPAAVDEAMVNRFLEAFQNTPGDEAIDADEKVARRWLTAALAAQPGGAE